MRTITRKQRGFTLVELAVVLAIIVLALAGIIARQRATNQTAQVQSETGNLQAVMGKVNSTFAGRTDYTGATTAFLLAQGAFPTSMVNGANVVNTWNGAVTVAPGAGNTSVDITYGGVPTSACIELVANASRSYRTVTVGVTAVKTAIQPEAVLATTQTACAVAATVAVIFNSSRF